MLFPDMLNSLPLALHVLWAAWDWQLKTVKPSIRDTKPEQHFLNGSAEQNSIATIIHIFY